MLTRNDFEYRKIHGVVPQLDNRNIQNCMSLIPKTPVVHSRFTTMGNVLKSANAGKIAGGIGNVFTGMLHLASGDVGYGLGKMAQGTIGAATGAIDPARISIDKDVADFIQRAEIEVWDRYSFLLNFIPAQGYLGDVYLKDGSCDDSHSGNGYKIYDNGDYFEGCWEDGEISWGIYIWADGERYFGNFDNGFKCGYGLTIFPNGSYYNGNSENSKQHGIGVMWYLDGVYYGEWYNGVRHGDGSCKYSDGTSFSGDWEDDSPIR